MCDWKTGFLLVLWLTVSPSFGQAIIELEISSKPSGFYVNEFGTLSRPGGPKVPESSWSNTYVLETVTSPRGELQQFYNKCPGLVTAFHLLRFRLDFDFGFPPEGHAAFTKVLDDALAKRQQLTEEYVRKATEAGRLAADYKFLERCYQQEQKADAELASVFLEIVPPDRLARYFVAMGPEYEFGLLSSRLFHECITENAIEFAARLQEAQKCCTLSIDALHKQKENDLKSYGRLPCPTIYENLSVDQFLTLRSLQGRVRPGEDIQSYLSRSKKWDTCMFVKAIRSLPAKGEKK